MLVLLEHDGAPVAATARPWDQVLTWLHARRLDEELAAGASPDASVALALRARRLVRGRVRRDLARSARRILAAATGAPGARHLPVPVCLDQVRACSPDFSALISGLLADGPVPPQGVAQACLLLTDATGPLYHRCGPGALRARVRAAAGALAAA